VAAQCAHEAPHQCGVESAARPERNVPTRASVALGAPERHQQRVRPHHRPPRDGLNQQQRANEDLIVRLLDADALLLAEGNVRGGRCLRAARTRSMAFTRRKPGATCVSSSTLLAVASLEARFSPAAVTPSGTFCTP